MPELPEVETVVRGLQGPLLQRTFTAVDIYWPNAIVTPMDELKTKLPGRKIRQLNRRGKYLRFTLSGDLFLLLHLKMSGSLLVEPDDEPIHPHVRTIFHLDNGHALRFKDPRKFGRVYLVEDPAEVTGKLGPEPLNPDFTFETFKKLFARRKGRLKPLLLNQEFIAGLGNIYVDESCFRARIDPRRPVDTLSTRALKRLYLAIQESLRYGIMLKGASFDEVYRGGQYQNHFLVYGRTGKPCPTCQHPVQRFIVGGRSTHICVRCQK